MSEWQKIIYSTMAALPYFGIGLGSPIIVLLRGCNIKVNLWKFQTTYWIKIFLINVLFQTVGNYYYGSNLSYVRLGALVNLIWVLLIPFWLYWAFRDEITKTLFVLFWGEGVSLAGNAIIGRMINLSVKTQGIKAENTLGPHTFVATVLGGAWLLFLARGGVKIFPFLRKMEIRHKWLVWVVYGLYTLTSILMNLHTSLNEETVLTHSDSIMSIMMILLIFGCIAYLRREQKYLQKENQNLLVQQRLMDAYNGALMEQIDLTKKMRHDIANHIQTLEELMYGNIQGERSLWIAEYAKELREQFNRLQNVVYCTNPLVNSVINNKVSRCRKENIRTDIIIHSFDYGKISNYEIISILFNLFDNAIDGCMKICEEKEKFLELICENRASWLFIQMKNSMRSMPETNGGRLKVNRKERITPGIGLAIVGDIVKRHGGLWEYQVSDGVFEIKVALEVDK